MVQIIIGKLIDGEKPELTIERICTICRADIWIDSRFLEQLGDIVCMCQDCAEKSGWRPGLGVMAS
jgi:hypothetical protein